MRKQYVALLLFLLLFLVLYSVLQFSHGQMSYLTFYMYDFEHNRWFARTFGLRQRTQSWYLPVTSSAPVSYASPSFRVYSAGDRTFWHNLWRGVFQFGSTYYVSYNDRYFFDTGTPPTSISWTDGTGTSGTVTTDNPYAWYLSVRSPAFIDPDTFAPVGVFWRFSRPASPTGTCTDYAWTSAAGLDSPYVMVSQYTATDGSAWLRGYGYDYDVNAPFVVVYVSNACYSTTAYVGDGTYVYYYGWSSWRNVGVLRLYESGCGFPLKPYGGGYRIVVGFDENYNPKLGPYVSTRYSTWLFLDDLNVYACLFQDGTLVLPHYRVMHVPVPSGMSFDDQFPTYMPLILDYNGDRYVAVVSGGDDAFHSIADYDGDGVPDIFYLSGNYDYRYELPPIFLYGIEFNGVPALPRDVNEQNFTFRLSYAFWPGTSFSATQISVFVDGVPYASLNTLSDWVTAPLSYGTHQICYSFTLPNGDDIDTYNPCYDVTISYQPWDVHFVYEQNGTFVVLIGYASDDGKIVRYEWNVDGNVFVRTLPVIELNLSPGHHGVCLTVYDDTNAWNTSCGDVFVKYVSVPHGVVSVPVKKPVYVPVTTVVGSEVATSPATALVVAVILVGLVVVLWLI